MQKKEEAEVKYIKLNSALVLALICLVVGFIAGTVYSIYKAPAEAPGRATQVAYDGTGIDSYTLPKQQELAALEKEVATNPENQNAWMALGNLYFDTHKYSQAIKAYTTYLELNPDNADVWTDLGVMYRRNKQPEEAVRSFDEAIKRDPRHEQARFNKGIVLMYDLNKKNEARAVWEELYRLNPYFKAPDGQTIKQILDKL